MGLFIFLFLIYLAIFYKKDYLFYPNENSTKTSFYTDENDNGKSEILDSIASDTSILFKYILKEGFSYPYSGVKMLQNDNSFFDLSSYNEVSVTLKSKNINHVMMYLLTKDTHVIDTNNRLALRRYSVDIQTDIATKTFTINLKDFKTPNWWFSLINQPMSDFNSYDISKTRGIEFMPGANPTLNVPIELTIYSISFHKNNTIPISLLILSYFLGVSLLYYFSLRKNLLTNIIAADTEKSIQISYVPVSYAEKSNSNDKLFQFINENYTNAELSLAQIAKHTGVNQRVISDTVATIYNCNLKTYINQIRVNEAKRLLKETNLNISEIAYMVGFNSPANFNRVFKTITGTSPSDYFKSLKNN